MPASSPIPIIISAGSLTPSKSWSQWENTLFIYIFGDNGASAEGTVHGTWSAPSMQNGFPEDPDWLLEKMDTFGGPDAENHFNVGWAWALDAPFQWTKQVASHFGGTRNALAVSWPNGIKDAGGLRTQFHHVIDIVPTILDAANIHGAGERQRRGAGAPRRREHALLL